MTPRLAVALLALAALSNAPLAAQIPGDPELAAVDSLLGAGNLDAARTRLQAWLASNPPGPGAAPPGAKAHALFLKGRLASDWAGAEDALLSVVLGYPTSPHAPDALLLLGKGLIAAASTGKPATAAIRAASYLERLVNDYPGNPLHAEGQLWLARAYAGSGRAEAACALLGQALTATTGDPEITRSLRADMESGCENTTGARTRPDSTSTAAPPPPATAEKPASPAAARDATTLPRGDYSVQVAALRSRESAVKLADELARAGFDARVVDIEGSGLVRVRIDVLGDATSAEALARGIRARGFDAIVVDDVSREKRRP